MPAARCSDAFRGGLGAARSAGLSALLISAGALAVPAPPTPVASELELIHRLAQEPRDMRGNQSPPAAKAPQLRIDPCRDWAPAEEEMIDGTKRRLHETLCGASLWFDGLFGERDNISAARGARGRLETSLTYSQYYGWETRTRLNVQVDLPNLEKRVSAFIGRDDDEGFVRDRAEGFALRSQFPELDDREKWLAGLGYNFPGSKRFRSDVRAGVRGLSHPRAFVQSRLRYNIYSDDRNIVHARLTPFWNTADGFGITPGLDYSRVLSQTRVFRWGNVGTISEKTGGFDWRSAFILYQGLEGGRGLAFETFIRGTTDEAVNLREYGGRVIFRQPLARKRLFLELISGYSWPRQKKDEVRNGSYLVGAGLELPFGQQD
jgi:hypothetical protein